MTGFGTAAAGWWPLAEEPPVCGGVNGVAASKSAANPSSSGDVLRHVGQRMLAKSVLHDVAYSSMQHEWNVCPQTMAVKCWSFVHMWSLQIVHCKYAEPS